MVSPALLLHPSDDVAVTRADVVAGRAVEVSGESVMARADIPAGHKVARRDIAAGLAIHKYGEVIGYATRPIMAGEHVHVHNLGYRPVVREYEPGVRRRGPLPPPSGDASFRGFVRASGRVGTRNYVGILTTVNCSASAARFVAAELERQRVLEGASMVDGVVALTHGSGCCLPPAGDGLAVLRRTLQGYARNPNFGGLLILALGCEVNQLQDLMGDPGFDVSVPFRALTIQEVGGTRETVDTGVRAVADMLPVVNDVVRTEVPCSELLVAMECGGSDGWSGITANPVVGAASDLIVRHGGTAVFGETPEIYGAEHLLVARAATSEVGERLAQRVRWWEAYTASNGASMDNNPTPGNKAGGLTTILEKSLGAIAKGGSSDLMGVYEYAEPITTKGLAFMDTPGYDPVSVTGMVAGGANVVCFTTGRGSVYGCKPVPSIKVASNTAMFQRMRDDMDLDAGAIVDGHATIEELGARLFRMILDVASGEPTKSESHGIGQDEFAPWPLGAVM